MVRADVNSTEKLPRKQGSRRLFKSIACLRGIDVFATDSRDVERDAVFLLSLDDSGYAVM
jgi:hypothetical protein